MYIRLNGEISLVRRHGKENENTGKNTKICFVDAGV
jgi:hypothetical protein